MLWLLWSKSFFLIAIIASSLLGLKKKKERKKEKLNTEHIPEVLVNKRASETNELTKV